VDGCRFAGNLYDDQTLAEQLKQTSMLMQDTQIKPETAFVDLSVNSNNPNVIGGASPQDETFDS